MLDRCETVKLKFGDILCEPGQKLRYAYFPLSGFISLLAMLNANQSLEMGLIGNEGMLGATMVLDVEISAMQGI